MERNYQNILGRTSKLSAKAACWYLQNAISEGMISDINFQPERNLYGRHLHFSSGQDLSFVMGLAATGLRTAAFLSGRSIEKNASQLEQAVRQQLPLVVIAGYESQTQLQHLRQTGATQLCASNVQEAADLLVIAHQVAEKSLIPVVLGIEYGLYEFAEDEVAMPGKQLLDHFLGNPDERISAPTPAQQMIFGKKRRRVPNWYNVDLPVKSGVSKNLRDRAFETAGGQQFMESHLPDQLLQSMMQWEEVTGRKHEPVQVHHFKKADHVVIAAGAISENVRNAIDGMKHNKHVGFLQLTQLYPMPEIQLEAFAENAKSITVLEQNTGNTHAPLFKETSAIPALTNTQKFSGQYGELPSVETLQLAIENMMSSGSQQPSFWLDVPFTHSQSKFPKHQVLLQAIERDYPGAKGASISAEGIGELPKHRQPASQFSRAVRIFEDHGPAYSRLSTFHDHTAALYESAEELVADPFKATTAVPPATAHFADMAEMREYVPVYDADKCTGCGECFVHCPHGAIPPTALDIEKLLQTAIKSAGNITNLVPMVKNLTKFAHKEIREAEAPITKVNDFLPNAFTKLADKMNLEGEKRDAATHEMETMLDEIGQTPVSVNDTFYHNRDQIDKDTGELFTLAIDPSACTGCGVCAAVCPEDALEMEAQTPDLVNRVQTDFDRWEKLPDTDSYTITRLLEDNDYDSTAAIMLSRHFYESMSGGSSTEKGAPEKAMLHLITTIAESAIQPKVQETLKSIGEWIKALEENVRGQMSSALPSANYDNLREALHEARGERIPFEDVIEKWSSREHLNLIDTNQLERKIELTESLKELKWALTEGPTGAGRARYGLQLDSEMNWASGYPWNPFTTPAIVHWDSDSTTMAKGLIQGQIRHMLDNIRLLRRAELEAKNKYEPNIHNAEIAKLSWKDLTEEEKALVPPMLLVAQRRKMTSESMLNLLDLLDQPWPVKLIVLDDANPPKDHANAYLSENNSWLLPAIALQKAYVLKSSLATPEHLFGGLETALQQEGAAICWLLAPDHFNHQIARQSWPKLNGLAWNSRAFSQFSYNPASEGDFISSKMELNANPAGEETWRKSELKYVDEDGEQTLEYAMTWADWAYSIENWHHEFTDFQPAMGAPVWVNEYLELDEQARKDKIPVIARIGAEGGLKRYAVADTIVAATEACQRSWQMLREVAGLTTAFPEKLRKKVADELTKEFEAQKAEMEKAYQEELENVEAEHLQRIKAKMKDKLLTLSNYAKSAE